MKIEFDKALLWLVPYLYLVSIAYYWGYWGYFDIDAFNYYPVSDLVKGVTGPISITFIIVALVSPMVALGRLIGEHLPSLSRKQWMWLGVVLTIIVIAIVVFKLFFKKTTTTTVTNLDSNNYFNTLRVILTSIGAIISFLIDETLPKQGAAKDAIRYSVILFFCLMPFEANVDGKTQARRIEQNERYDYTVVDSLATPEKAVYKFLGKAGDYYILLSFDNTKRIIVPVTKLNPLLIESYPQDSPATEAILEKRKKQLELIAPKEPPK
jgi:hypothetical protein